MRLLDTNSFPPPVPKDQHVIDDKYVILSHTWGTDEVVLDDLKNYRQNKKKAGWKKIQGALRQATRDQFDSIWIDTCCIDKSSSAELGEAINSMYKWYHEALFCYVYLEDFASSSVLRDEDLLLADGNIDETKKGAELKACRWFKRAWTLQELIAPREIIFFDRHWNYIGTRTDISATIAKITKIHVDVFESGHSGFSIAQKMSWAAGRECTRIEDRAYALLGILGVNLDIRYGEGLGAFTRLQEELIQRSTDQSVFAWDDILPQVKPFQSSHKSPNQESQTTGLLALSPDQFAGAGKIIPLSMSSVYTMTNKGLHLKALVVDKQYILLECCYDDDPTTSILLNALWKSRSDYGSKTCALRLKKRSIDYQRNDYDGFCRLAFIDSDVARARSKEEEVVILRNRETNLMFQRPVSQQAQGLLWLRMETRDGNGPYVFQESSPPPHPNRRNILWTLERFFELQIHIKHPSNKSRIEINVEFRDRTTAYINVIVQRQESPTTTQVIAEKMARTRIRWPQFTKLPVKTSEYLHKNIAVSVELKEETLNGVMVHVLEIGSERRTPSPGFN